MSSPRHSGWTVTELRIASRGSPLAMAQTRAVAQRLVDAIPDLTVELIQVDTSGDRDRSSAIAELTELGAFVRAVQREVIEGRADLAVHSLKDLPVDGPPELAVAAYPERAAPNDVMVGATLDSLPLRSVVGAGGPRRAAQLRRHRPDLKTTELRGNVDTRLRKVDSGEVAAAILAEAGLTRLGREDAIAQRLDLETMVPAPGQGALAVEARSGSEAAEMAAVIDDPSLRPLVTAERALLGETGAGCRSSLGALAYWEDGGMRMDVFVEDHRGARYGSVAGDEVGGLVELARREVGL